MAKRILLVDDERDLVFYTKLFLEEKGYEILEAYDKYSGLGIPMSEIYRRAMIKDFKCSVRRITKTRLWVQLHRLQHTQKAV